MVASTPIQALLDRARANIATSDLPRLVMSDPGTRDYIVAYERVLARGVSALFEKNAESGTPLIRGFDITENLLLSHADAAKSVVHRWFSVLTGCIELLDDGTSRDVPFASTLGTLLVDTFALAEGGVREPPLDLLACVCRDLGRESPNPNHAALALLGELLAAGEALGDDEIDALCTRLVERQKAAEDWYGPDGEPNPYFSDRPLLAWRSELTRRQQRAWLDLVHRHFPARTEIARQTVQRLLDEAK